MKKIILPFLMLLALAALPLNAQKKFVAEKLDKCDPYMTLQGGYGYLIKKTPKADVWWAEGCYKVMKDTPVAKRRGGTVKMTTAKNEYESFILVVNPKKELKDLKVEVSGLPDDIEFKIRKAEYINLIYTSDTFGYPGDWPDPLPMYDEPQDAPKGENTSFWITIKTPASHPAGSYSGRVTVSEASGWKVSAPISVKVRSFSLPGRPTVAADMGLFFDQVIKYENLNTPEQKRESFDNYIKTFDEYKIQLRDPFYLNPIKYTVTQPEWTGGWYDSSTAAEGNYSYCLADNSGGANVEAVWGPKLIPVQSDRSYKIVLNAKSDTEHSSVVVVDCFDENRNLLTYRRRYKYINCTDSWQEFTLELPLLDKRTAYIQVRLFGAGYEASGADTGTMWFDNVRVIDGVSGENLFPQGNFEIDPSKINIDVDFTEFNKMAEKLRDIESFRYFSVNIAGIGGVNFEHSRPGQIGGFRQGSPEYEMLMKDCLTKLQAGLKESGMLDHTLVYWGDEPTPPAYPVLEDTHRLIKKYAPGIRTFMTEIITWREHRYDTMDISGSTDISCVSWECFENHAVIKKYQQRPEQEPWNYLCATTQYPYFTDFIDHNGIDMRIWLWASYMYQFKGILIWASTFWNAGSQYGKGELQNPWTDPYCFATSDQLVQRLLAVGDGILFYPNNRHPNEDRTTAYTGEPIPCIRLEIMRDGMEDYEYLAMLEALIPKMSAADAAKARDLLVLPPEVFKDDNLEQTESYFIQDPQFLFERREQIARLIEKYR